MNKNLLTTFFFSIITAIIIVGLYHFYLIKQDLIGKRIKGVYTVDIITPIKELRKKIIEANAAGSTVNIEKELKILEEKIRLIADKLPEGYILLPEDIVLGGQRKVIDIKTGKVEKRKLPSKIFLFEK